MRTVTKTYNVYEFGELSKEIQEKLIEKEMEYQCEIFCEHYLKGEMEYQAMQLLAKYFNGKAEFKRVLYDLGYSQGDGAMIEFDVKYYGKNISIKHNYSNYYHAYSFTVNYNDYEYLSEDREKKLKKKIVAMNKELEKFGYGTIETENFRDLAEEELAMGDYEFLENGEVF